MAQLSSYHVRHASAPRSSQPTGDGYGCPFIKKKKDLFHFFFQFLFMCICPHKFMCGPGVQVPARPEDGARSPGTTGGCELPDGKAGN